MGALMLIFAMASSTGEGSMMAVKWPNMEVCEANRNTATMKMKASEFESGAHPDYVAIACVTPVKLEVI